MKRDRMKAGKNGRKGKADLRRRRPDETEEKAFPSPGRTPREDTASVMRFYEIQDKFPAEALEEAKRVSERIEDAGRRLDLRKTFIFTCDPVTARDYDDAISVEPARGGGTRLGVHIADVSHFVVPGGALDREAMRRSTSVYFADRVVPMLPEALSNGVCSLVPGEDRLAFSVFMTFDRDGNMKSREFAKSVIRSSARFTYEQVMRVISGGRKRKGDGVGTRERRAILAVHELAQKLRARRFADGALDIEIPEAEVTLDRAGELSGIVTRPYDESHQMIEECMVAANEAVATELWTNGVKILARLHEPPDEEKLQMLRADAHALGVKAGGLVGRKAFSHFLRAIKSHPLYPTLAVMVLRSMKRAVYDSTKMGHFGLAKRFYAHFTSPIRRYPDLTLHRQLAAYLAGGSCRIEPGRLAKLAEHCSAMEERAAEAERSLLEIKKYRLLEDQLSSRQLIEYDAVVSKCMPFGLFVEVPEIAVSGLVHVSVLSRRYVRYEEDLRALREPGGRTWRVGDGMKVRVAKVDFKQRRIDFVPA